MSTAIYIHLPWCIKRCPYCDFNAHKVMPSSDFSAYCQAICRDLSEQSNLLEPDSEIGSVYFGGGTPSLFSPQHIELMIDGVSKHFKLLPDIEISMECNPGAREHGDLSAYCRAGVNRLSLGVQSLQPKHLQRLGRVHDHIAAGHAIEQALQSGFQSVNVDLMYGLPGQTVSQALSDLKKALAYGVSHISWYQLTLEPNTVFAKYPPKGLPNLDQIVEIEEAGRRLLVDHGFQRYEISAYAKSGHACQHNLAIWEFGDYLGVGAGAHGKVTVDGQVQRTVKLRTPASYIERPTYAKVEIVDSHHQVMFEYMLNRLRVLSPLSSQSFVRDTGLPWSLVTDHLAGAEIPAGLLAYDDQGLELTHKGYDFLNDITTIFVEDNV